MLPTSCRTTPACCVPAQIVPSWVWASALMVASGSPPTCFPLGSILCPLSNPRCLSIISIPCPSSPKNRLPLASSNMLNALEWLKPFDTLGLCLNIFNIVLLEFTRCKPPPQVPTHSQPARSNSMGLTKSSAKLLVCAKSLRKVCNTRPSLAETILIPPPKVASQI